MGVGDDDVPVRVEGTEGETPAELKEELKEAQEVVKEAKADGADPELLKELKGVVDDIKAELAEMRGRLAPAPKTETLPTPAEVKPTKDEAPKAERKRHVWWG